MWMKVDDQLAFHRKTLAAGNAAMGLWVRAGAWLAGQKRTDAPGVITVRELRTMGTETEVKKLVAAGFLEPVRYHGERACRFHDWSEYQPRPEDLDGRRNEWSTRKRRQRKHRGGDHSECLPQHCDLAFPDPDEDEPPAGEWRDHA